MGLDYDDEKDGLDGAVDLTYDSLLPCTTYDAMHKASTQIPCVRIDTICNPKGSVR
jgi:hypothetical protein